MNNIITNNKYILIGAIALIAILVGLALWLGLRGGESGGIFSPEPRTGIFVHGESGATILTIELDEEGVRTDQITSLTIPASGTLTLDLENGAYQIMATKGEGFWPWTKTLSVSEGTSTEFHTFFMPMTAELETSTDDEIVALFATAPTLPTEEEPLLSSDGNTSIYVNEGTVFINWLGGIDDMPEYICPGGGIEECRANTVYTPENHPIENISFFGENDHLLIIDRGTDIFVVEIDKRVTQNAQFVYMSESPVAFRMVEGDVYISQGGVVSRVVLD